MKKLSVLLALFLLLTACGQANERKEENGEKERVVELEVDAREESEKVTFVIQIENETEKEVTFEFPSSQLYEIIVHDENGEEVYRYSVGKMFMQAIHYETIEANGYREWKESWNYMKDGERVAPGEYDVTVEWKGNLKEGSTELVAEEDFDVPMKHPSIANVKVGHKEDHVIITGESITAGEEIHYVIEDGHNELAKGKVPIEAKDKWTPFTINVKKTELKSDRNKILLLYAKESKEPFIITIQEETK